MGSPGQYTGRSLGSVKLLERIGSGGMGEVYRGFHEVLEMEVAIKVILPNQTTNADFVKRFIREAQACAQLSHPNILRVFTADKQDDLYYIVLEYVDGTDLKVVLRRHKQIPWEKTVAIVEQACEGLAYAHKKGIVHRDIKPDNLLISRRGEIKIADFGLATIRAEVTGITATGQVLGTPLYMSPEQCDGQTADWRSDIYSLGATWYHLIAGRPPYTGDSTAAVIAQHLIKDVAFPKDKFERVPERIRALIAWMMRRERDYRVQNLEEIRAQLVAIDHASQRERREVVKEVVDVTRRLEAQQYRGPATSSASNGQLTPHVYQEALPMGPDGTDLRSSGRLPTMPNRHPSSSNRIPAPNMGSGEPSRSSQQMPVFASPDSRSSSRLPTTPPPAPPLRDSSPPPMQAVPMVPMEVRKSTPMVPPPQPVVGLPDDPPPLMPPPPPPRSANPLSSSSASLDTAAARTAATRADRISGVHPVPSSSGTWRAPASRAATPPPGSARAVEFGSESTEDVPVGGASPWASGGVVGVPVLGHSGSPHRPANSHFPDAAANDGANRVLVVVLLLLVVGALVGMVVMLAYGVNPDPSSNHVPPTTARPAWIYFSRDLSPTESDLYKIRVDGQELIQVTSKPGREFFPAVSARGNRVAFIHQHEGKSEIVSVTTDGTETWARMTESLAGGVRGPLGWADNSDALYFIDDAGNFCTLSLRQIDGGSLRRQRVGDRHIAQFELDPHSPRRLIFTEIGRGGISHLWAVPMEPMTDPKRLGLAANVVHPRLSPNGQRLLYMEADFDNPGFGQLNVADRNGLHPMPIELDHLRAYGRPAWTPDGRIVFAAKYVPPDTASSSEFARAPWLEWNLYVIEPPTHAVPKKTPIPLLAEPWRVTEIDCGPGQ